MSTQQEISDALAANFLLVQLQIRSWSGKKTDREASQELLDSKQASKDGGAFVKNLLASANQELKALQQAAGGLRQYVYEHTLPWSAAKSGALRGDRIVRVSAAMDFLTNMKPLKQEYDDALVTLESVWDVRIASAQRNLGALADANDYPASFELHDLFDVTIDLKPIPAVGDFSRLNIPGELAESLTARHQTLAESQLQNAMNDLRDRFVAELERMHVQLSKAAAGEKTRLHDSLVGNLQGLVNLAKTMDLGINDKFTDLVARVEAELLRHPVGMYKVSPATAREVATAAQILAVEAAAEAIWTN